jgi:hypothetical protein
MIVVLTLVAIAALAPFFGADSRFQHSHVGGQS